MAVKRATAAPRTIVCTLFEGHHGLGVGALVNSLVEVGFDDVVVAGYRGSLPAWADQLKDSEIAGVRVRFVKLDTTSHLSNFKPLFINDAIKLEQLRDSDAIVYFDSDIVVRGPWKYFCDWCRFGVAVCEDVNSPMHATHPKKLGWHAILPDVYRSKRELDVYVNGGFLGLLVADRAILRIWDDVIARGFDRREWYTEKRPTDLFSSFDQDALNIAITANAGELSIVGKEQMDFGPGGYLMSHAIGPAKPWKGKFFLKALRGRGIRRADREYIRVMNRHIRVHPPSSSAWLRANFFIARVVAVLLGRR